MERHPYTSHRGTLPSQMDTPSAPDIHFKLSVPGTSCTPDMSDLEVFPQVAANTTDLTAEEFDFTDAELWRQYAN
jgi:hypothetical protein